MSNPELALLVAVPILAATLPLLAGLRLESVGWPIAAVTAAIELALAGYVVSNVARGGRYTHTLGDYPASTASSSSPTASRPSSSPLSPSSPSRFSATPAAAARGETPSTARISCCVAG